jgi:hypothetical protein
MKTRIPAIIAVIMLGACTAEPTGTSRLEQSLCMLNPETGQCYTTQEIALQMSIDDVQSEYDATDVAPSYGCIGPSPLTCGVTGYVPGLGLVYFLCHVYYNPNGSVNHVSCAVGAS